MNNCLMLIKAHGMVSPAEPYHRKYFPFPRINELMFKQELDRLEYLKVMKKFNHSQWGAPKFLITKKDSTVRFVMITHKYIFQRVKK